MNIEQYREYCISKKGVTEDAPFDDTSLVFRIGGKIFVLLDLEEMRINLKCDPEKAIRIREEYPVVQTGYHMNKKHWNTVPLNLISEDLLKEWTDHSYDLVFEKLPQTIKMELSK
ncbi:MAG: MmcQ/YjbR family DNA-binding protein [Bacteroidales bacterium]|jgi:predicted DNA-binding protein (MmcQ/YjbR family)|nr:MmcQ/YjbR family DNA-binding protein [Bacteroidales bacterium]